MMVYYKELDYHPLVTIIIFLDGFTAGIWKFQQKASVNYTHLKTSVTNLRVKRTLKFLFNAEYESQLFLQH